MTVLLPSLDRGDDEVNTEWVCFGWTLDLLASVLEERMGLVVSRRKYREDGSVLTQFDQTWSLSRRVFWPVTTSVAIKKSSTNHAPDISYEWLKTRFIWKHFFSHIVFPIHYASGIVFQVHWFDSWLERKSQSFPRVGPKDKVAPSLITQDSWVDVPWNSITVSGKLWSQWAPSKWEEVNFSPSLWNACVNRLKWAV